MLNISVMKLDKTIHTDIARKRLTDLNKIISKAQHMTNADRVTRFISIMVTTEYQTSQPADFKSGG